MQAPLLRSFLKTVVVLFGVMGTASLLIVSIRNASLLGCLEAAVLALAVFVILSHLRQDDAAVKKAPSDGEGGRNTKLIAMGLAIGFLGPILLLWLITSLLG